MVKFNLVLRFRGALNVTRPNAAFGEESTWGKRANDVNHEIHDIGCVEWNCWNSVQQLPFHILVMEQQGEEVPDFVRSANDTEPVRVKPTMLETFLECSFFIISNEVTIHYVTFTKDGLKNARDGYILKLCRLWRPPSESSAGIFKSFNQFLWTDFFQK